MEYKKPAPISYEIAEHWLTSAFKGCLEYVNRDLKDYQNIELDVQFRMSLEKNKIDATASKRRDGGYLVEVSMATCNIIYAYYHKILSTQGGYSAFTFNQRFDSDTALKYVLHLTMKTLQAIIFHELGHIFNGHIDYIQFKMGEYQKSHPEYGKVNLLPEYLETSNEARPYLEPIDWQALEWNADDFSATRLIGQSTYKDNIDGQIVKSIEHAFFLSTWVVITMYCFMDLNAKKDPKMLMGYCSKEHLPKRFRLLIYLDVAMIAVKKFNGIDIFNVLPSGTYPQLIKRIEQWYVIYTKTERGEVQEGGSFDESDTTTENNKEELDEAHLAYYEEVNRYYMDRLDEELKRFTYFYVFS
ncbi:MAG: hypothetical protein VB035_02510 [Candidatus Fimivivens sp.]|nr:hypothetical protein [Candidatus Fimivivens sp.]